MCGIEFDGRSEPIMADAKEEGAAAAPAPPAAADAPHRWSLDQVKEMAKSKPQLVAAIGVVLLALIVWRLMPVHGTC